MSLAWLNLRAREYIAEHPGTGGAIEAAQFMQQLRDPQYGDELLTGYGALLGMTSSGAGALVSSLDKQAAYEEAFNLIVSRTPSTIPLSDRDQAVLDVLIPMANGMQWVLEKFPLGRAYLTVGEDPGDAAAYARLGAQIGTVFANKLAVDALFAGTPWGAAITATKFGAQVGLFVLSMGAVQDALGEGPTLYLRGQLTMAGATAALLGDTISDLGAAGAEIAIQSAPHFVEFSDAVNRGDAAGIASSIGEIAMDYYKLQTGVDLRLYGPIGERFADLMVHLFTGDTGALGDDVRALGSAYLDTILQNPYLAAIGERMVQYAETINGALSDINNSYRILGQNALTGLLLVGTRLDDAGNAIRDVAHKVGGFFGSILQWPRHRRLHRRRHRLRRRQLQRRARCRRALDHHRRQRPLYDRSERRAAGPAGRLRHRHEPGFHRHDAGAGGFNRGHAVDHPHPAGGGIDQRRSRRRPAARRVGARAQSQPRPQRFRSHHRHAHRRGRCCGRVCDGVQRAEHRLAAAGGGRHRCLRGACGADRGGAHPRPDGCRHRHGHRRKCGSSPPASSARSRSSPPPATHWPSRRSPRAAIP